MGNIRTRNKRSIMYRNRLLIKERVMRPEIGELGNNAKENRTY